MVVDYVGMTEYREFAESTMTGGNEKGI